MFAVGSEEGSRTSGATYHNSHEEEARRLSLSTALEVFEAVMRRPATHVAGGGRSRALSWCRCLFATFAVSWLGHPVKSVAASLGKAPGSVSRRLGEGLELQLSEPTLGSGLERMREVMIRAPAR